MKLVMGRPCCCAAANAWAAAEKTLLRMTTPPCARPLEADAEITMEANPGSFEAGKFRDYAASGVNRLSIGIQSFNAAQLTRLGRIHGHDEALRAADIAHSAGFDNFNLDLMFALPGQTEAEWAADVAEAVTRDPPGAPARRPRRPLRPKGGSAGSPRSRSGRCDSPKT